MYSPNKDVQSGGDYTVVNDDGTTVIVSQSTMNLIAELSQVNTFASMTSFVNLNSLTPTQLDSLLTTLHDQIIADDKMIQEDESNIATYQLEINTPITGLQARYDSTIISYSSAVIDYNNSVAASTLNADLIYQYISTIDYLTVIDRDQLSTLNSYQLEYDALFLQVSNNTQAVTDQQNGYNILSTTYHEYINNLSIVTTGRTTLEAAYSKYLQSLTSSDLANVNNLSSIYRQDLQTSQSLSSIIIQKYESEANLKELMLSTSTGVSVLAYNSTLFANPLIFTSDLPAYIESLTSTLNGLMKEKAALQILLDSYDTTNPTVSTDNTTVYTNLLTNISAFYTKAQNQVTNQILYYEYQVKEWSSFVGFIVTSLFIQKAIIALEINGVAITDFAVTGYIPSGETPTTPYTITMTAIQNIVNVLNVMDASFNEVIGLCEREKTYRETYMNTMLAMTSLQAEVFGLLNTNAGITDDYLKYNETLITTLESIHSFQSERTSKMNTIMDAISPQISNVRSLITSKSIIIDEFVYPNSIPRSETPFATDPKVYQVFPPLEVYYGSST